MVAVRAPPGHRATLAHAQRRGFPLRRRHGRVRQERAGPGHQRRGDRGVRAAAAEVGDGQQRGHGGRRACPGCGRGGGEQASCGRGEAARAEGASPLAGEEGSRSPMLLRSAGARVGGTHRGGGSRASSEEGAREAGQLACGAARADGREREGGIRGWWIQGLEIII